MIEIKYMNGMMPSNGDAVMLDLETLGTGPNSAIISIGACSFDEGHIVSTFHAIIDKQTCFELGCTFDQSTIDWWENQSDEAKAASYNATETVPVKEALLAFADWMKGKGTIWGNGSDFDNAMLAELYNKAGMDLPWKFWNNRCYRTMKNMFPDVKMVRHGTHHNAVDDAITQAKHLMSILNRLGNMRKALG